jgi:hypothetical protein
MDPARDALIGGVLPGAIATTALLGAGVLIALHRGAPPPPPALPEKPRPMAPRGVLERAVAFVAMLIIGAGLVLSMRWLEAYPADWWPTAVDKRTPALVGLGAVLAAIVAAGPARWCFALPVCVVGAGVISFGIRQPLPATENLPLAVVLDALAIGPAAFLVQKLIDRSANAHRPLLARPLPIVVLALALLAVPGLLFFSGISVSSRQSGLVQAVLMSAAVVLAIVGNSAGRGALRGVGVLAIMAIGVWMLLARTLGEPILSDWAVFCLLLAAAQAGVAAIVVGRARRTWLAVLLTIALVGAPMGAALAAQYAAGDRGEGSAGSPADYGY